jgi:uncharacterized pyridoxamine 5'-phosphate oxidase family protein
MGTFWGGGGGGLQKPTNLYLHFVKKKLYIYARSAKPHFKEIINYLNKFCAAESALGVW